MSQRILIVGGGMAGASLAWWLGQLGAGPRTTLLEREPLLGLHATGQNAAILRTAVTPWATRVLAEQTRQFLQNPPPGFAPAPLLRRRGLLLAEGTHKDPLPLWLDDHLSWNSVQPLSRARQHQLAPHFSPLGERCWWFPHQGEIDVALLLERFAAGARKSGVRVETGREVTGWMRSGTSEPRVCGVRLADGSQLEADVTVIAAGAWAPSLSSDLSGPVAMRVTRRHLMVSAPTTTVAPDSPVVWDDQAGFYARPESAGLLMSACDLCDVEPDALRPDPDVQRLLAEKVERLLPHCGDLGLAHFWPGMRTLTDDDVPWIGPDSRCAGLFWLAGLGGHGISVGAAAGRVAAEQLCGHAIDDELRAALDPGRQVTLAVPL